MNKDAKRYYKEIKSLFPSKGKNEKRLLKSYKERILELSENQPNISYSDLLENFGSPAEIISEYYESVDTAYLIKRLRTTKFIRICLYCLLFLIVLGFFISVGLNVKLYQQASDSIIIREQIIIE